jgi:hypothetical protein
MTLAVPGEISEQVVAHNILVIKEEKALLCGWTYILI